MEWYRVLYFGIMLGLLGVLIFARFVEEKKRKKPSVAIKRFTGQPRILEDCPRCLYRQVYYLTPEHPPEDFEKKIKTPRVMCLFGSDPWREESCPNFVRDNARFAKDCLLTNGD